MSTSSRIVVKLFAVGGWAPLLVFAVHLVTTQVVNVYRTWPEFDIPMHVAGGLALAYFVSGSYRAMPRSSPRNGRIVLLEVGLIMTVTTTAAVIWEFMEFALDQTLGTMLQVSLVNTMQDLALGMAGAAMFAILRMPPLAARPRDVRAVVMEWLQGRAA